MRAVLALLVALLASAPLAAFEVAPDTGTCLGAAREVEARLESGELNRAGDAYGQVQRLCLSLDHPDLAYCLGRRIAIARYEQALKLASDSANRRRVLALVGGALDYGAPWQSVTARAELALEVSDFTTAARLFPLALDDFAGETPICAAERQLMAAMEPDRRAAIARQLFHAAETSLLRARAYVEPVGYRCCGATGLLAASFHGYTPEARNFRVDFAPARATLAGRAADAVALLSAYLASDEGAAWSIAVHTEAMSTAGLACRLADVRAKVLAAEIARRLPQAKVTWIAAGDAVPYAAHVGDIGSGKTVDLKLARLEVTRAAPDGQAAAPAPCPTRP